MPGHGALSSRDVWTRHPDVRRAGRSRYHAVDDVERIQFRELRYAGHHGDEDLPGRRQVVDAERRHRLQSGRHLRIERITHRTSSLPRPLSVTSNTVSAARLAATTANCCRIPDLAASSGASVPRCRCSAVSDAKTVWCQLGHWPNDLTTILELPSGLTIH